MESEILVISFEVKWILLCTVFIVIKKHGSKKCGISHLNHILGVKKIINFNFNYLILLY